MKPEQPAWQLRDKDEESNTAALTAILAEAPAPRRILEFFGGIGGMTVVLRLRYPEVPIETWDLDEECIRLISARGIGNLLPILGDSLASAEPLDGDGVSMDFNNLTLQTAHRVRYWPALNRVFTANPLWVHITDAARSRLHLNYKVYGLESPDHEAYLVEWDSFVSQHWPGYRLVQTAGHFRATLMLFARVQ